ncbi:MAG TPA: hypothetical protein VMU71_07075, partial [Terracidiphilus sp.]|nr:hypothetical protein [Terracidiphilus sp.]
MPGNAAARIAQNAATGSQIRSSPALNFIVDPFKVNRLIWPLPFNYAPLGRGKGELQAFTKIMVSRA